MVGHIRLPGNVLLGDASFISSRDSTAVSPSRLLSRPEQKKSFICQAILLGATLFAAHIPELQSMASAKIYSLSCVTGPSRLLRDTCVICEDSQLQSGSSTPKRAATCAAVQSSVVTGRLSSRHALRPPSRTHTFSIPLRRNRTAVRALVI